MKVNLSGSPARSGEKGWIEGSCSRRVRRRGTDTGHAPGASPIPNTEWRRRPSEALPVWDITANCILINDGHSSTVHSWTRSTGRRDEVQFEFPDDMEPAYSFGDSRFEPSARFPQGFQFPEPKLQMRISNIAMAPNGVI